MSDNKPDRLDAALATLSPDVELKTDLWPAIRAEIEAHSRTSMRRFPSRRLLGQIAAGVALVAVSSVITYLLTQKPLQQITVQTKTAAEVANSAMRFDGDTLGVKYVQARADLDRLFAERIASLPPATRTKLLSNLADMRRASNEIAATLASYPSDPLLQELLISTHRRELQLLADVGQLNIPTMQRISL